MHINRVSTWLAVNLFFLVLLAVPSTAGSGPRASGGGIVDGPLGLTSQLGFGATMAGGSFQCVMAGRSSGFPFGPWEEILQMEVHGDVTPGSLSINADGSATFGGTAFVLVVGRDADGNILTARFSNVPYSATHSAGGPGEAMHELFILGIHFGPAPLQAGHITIAP
jgi:hypothetical protein